MRLLDKTIRLVRAGVVQAIKREIDCLNVTPRVGTLFLTYRCSSHCKACTMWQRAADRERELGLAEWKSAADILYAQGVRHVEIFGGDVFLRKDLLFPLLRYLKQKGFVLHLPTNAILLDRETAIELAKTEVDVLYFSTDGVDQDHDRIRGTDGNFDKLKRAITSVMEARSSDRVPFVTCNVTISTLNFNDVGDILSFAAEYGCDGVNIEYVGEMTQQDIDGSAIDGLKPTPYYIRQEQSLLLNREQAREFKDSLIRIKRNHGVAAPRLSTLNVDVLSIEDMANGTIPHKMCHVERTEVTIDPYGRLVACPFFNNYIIGHILKDPFDTLWNNHRHRTFRECQNAGRIAMCNHCILGVQRNPSFLGTIKRAIISN